MGIIRALACLPLLAACGGDMSGLTGIYTIDSWTENTAGCDVEGGPHPFETSTALYIKEENFFGSFLNVKTCADLAECETLAADDETINLGNWGFIDGNDDDGWVELDAYAFTNIDDECEATGSEDRMTSPAEGQLRIEVRTTHSDPYPATGPADDPCPDAGAEAAVDGLPCEELEVVSATFDGPLP